VPGNKKGEEIPNFYLIKDGTFFPLFLSKEPATEQRPPERATPRSSHGLPTRGAYLCFYYLE
jgi:hypothetical protein